MPNVKKADFDRDAAAAWYAQRHLDIDTGIEEIHYLPRNAPAREIRLLEVNNLVAAMNELQPIDFGVDVDGADGQVLLVLDVTPAQWQAIQDRQLNLPAGWVLQGKRTFKR